MRRTRSARLLLAALAGVALTAATPPAVAQPPPPVVADPPAALAFAADVVVEWVDGLGRHEARLSVVSSGGRLRIDGPAPLRADAGGRRVLHDGGWYRLWPSALVGLAEPPLSRKYDVHSRRGAPVAGRDTRMVELSAAGRLRERLALDVVTGLVLRRQVLDDLGRVVRTVTVERLRFDPAPPATAGAAGTAGAPGVERMNGSVPYRTSFRLAGGYERVGRYRRGDIVHLLYSDGLHGLSVFVQPGRLARAALPGGGRGVRVGSRPAFAYPWPGGEALTWEAGDAVYTVVGDGSLDEVIAAARSVPEPVPPPLVARVRRSARAVAELVSPRF